ncbi:MAG: hypothetical protein HUJ22_02280 [Gracilimonas sp.]|uniref:ABC-three component system protein n=1 Tax=Gracilimonas sp. TaxID=1974203 RepID=UPI0019900D8E|nr:ABC-three component system protein [Gracilimonas sp.]MBD3615372.1 hypothetical protein [Gracilimonas sp.]
MTEKYSAKDSNLGYLYQAKYALYEIIRSDQEEDASITIEGLDDFDIKKLGSVTKLGQLKHHRKPGGNLTDASPDIWKTLRIWIETYKKGELLFDRVTLFLITTSSIKDDSIAAKLTKSNLRDIDDASKRLIKVAKESKNKDLKDCFDAFIALSEAERELILSRIIVRGKAYSFEELEKLIKNFLQYSVNPDRIQSAYTRLVGWWNNQILDILLAEKQVYIQRQNVLSKIREIASQFTIDSLPVDLLDIHFTDHNASDYQDYQFVEQLKSIDVGKERIRNCIFDYYRAYTQRNKWITEDLLIDNELESYEKRLINEWKRQRIIIKDSEGIDDSSKEEELKKFGKKVLNWVEQKAELQIRSDVKDDGYVMRGSYQMLADEEDPKIYWHPNFMEKFKELIK